MKRRALIFVIVFMSAVFPAGKRLYAGPRQESPASPAPLEKTVFTDSAGRDVSLPAKISRVSPSGSLAQMFLLSIAPDMLCTIASDLSAGEREFLPAHLAGLPVVGQFYGSRDINLEEIAAIGPDLVIDVGEIKKNIAQDMDAITASTALPAVHITADLESTPRAFRTLGKLLGRPEKGEALAAFCEKTLAAVNEVMMKAGDNKKSVLYCMGKAGTNVLAKGSFHGEVLDRLSDNRAVVNNISSRGSGNETDLEQISVWNPDVILFGPESVYEDAGTDRAWRQLRAIQSGSYFKVPEGPYNWMGSPPSVNRYMGMLWLCKILYPEYARYDLYSEAAEYYRLFYGYELSRERYERLVSR
jgi:iron complex transport system substrate-binding protein